MSVEIYTTPFCPYCIRAKMLLKKRKIKYVEIPVGHNPEMRLKLVEQTGMRTVPQIFIHGKPIGGFTELHALDSKGSLSKLIQSEP